jgi:predicted  nucleic acid-binding Zn-ribbon protein
MDPNGDKFDEPLRLMREQVETTRAGFERLETRTEKVETETRALREEMRPASKRSKARSTS